MRRLDVTADKNKWIEAVGKLTTLTQKKRLFWRTAPIPSDLTTATLRSGVVYEANYKGKTLRLYEKRDALHLWNSVLELVDASNSVWAFPTTQATEDLLGAVQYQIGQVGDFVDSVLAEAV